MMKNFLCDTLCLRVFVALYFVTGQQIYNKINILRQLIRIFVKQKTSHHCRLNSILASDLCSHY